MNTTLTALAKLSFSLGEAATICGIVPKQLRKLVNQSRIAPAFRGGIGHPHRLSPQQVVGIAIASALADSPGGCSGKYADRMVRLWGSVDEGAFLHWLGAKRDDYTEESYSVWRSGPAFPPPTEENSEDEAGRAAFLARVNKVCDAIRARIGMPTADRTTNKAHDRTSAGTTKACTSRS